jgi:hypothetical protein
MMEQDFSCRSHQLEMMDGDAKGYEDFRRCLHDLEIVNVCTLAYRPTLHWLKKALRGDKSRQPVSILDIGSGGGGIMRKIWKWAQRRGRETHLTGVDVNPWSKQSAESVTPPGAPIEYETSDIFSLDPDRRADFIIEPSDRIREGASHNGSEKKVGDADADRYDGPISVARAFTAADWRRLVAEAGIPAKRISINWFFPFRYCVAGRKA